MTGRVRANGEGSIFPYRNGYAAYAWVRTPEGLRKKKWVYGKTRDEVNVKWTKLQQEARERPVSTKAPTVGEQVMYWLDSIVKPNSAPLTYATYETYIRMYILPHLGRAKLDRLSVRDVQTWINKIAGECQCCAQGKDRRRPEEKRRCCAISKVLSSATVSPDTRQHPSHAPVRSRSRPVGRAACAERRGRRPDAEDPETEAPGMVERRGPPLPRIRPQRRRPVVRRLRPDPGTGPPQG